MVNAGAPYPGKQMYATGCEGHDAATIGPVGLNPLRGSQGTNECECSCEDENSASHIFRFQSNRRRHSLFEARPRESRARNTAHLNSPVRNSVSNTHARDEHDSLCSGMFYPAARESSKWAQKRNDYSGVQTSGSMTGAATKRTFLCGKLWRSSTNVNFQALRALKLVTELGVERRQRMEKRENRRAEGERFELSVEVDPLRRFSKPLVSATHPPLRGKIPWSNCDRTTETYEISPISATSG